MGTDGETFNAHVLTATWHHKHVRPMTDDSILRRGIGQVLSRWGGLQMAVKNQWGGHDSLKKSQELAHQLFNLFSQSNVITVEEIENMKACFFHSIQSSKMAALKRNYFHFN